MKTFSQKPADVSRDWYVIDAQSATLGRLATQAASLLLGKGKSSVTPHVDGGDFVIIVNATKLKVTGNKLQDKTYYNHSGYPSGLRTRTLGNMIDKNPIEVIEIAVRGMLPDNKLRAGRLSRLKIYAGESHPHTPQQPKNFEVRNGK